MLSMSEKDRANVAAIIESAGKIKTFVSGINSADEFYRDDKTFDAVLMNFVIIGEAAGKLSDTAKKQYSDVPWARVKSFRNLVVHNYFGVDAEEVWQLIQRDLPALLHHLKQN